MFSLKRLFRSFRCAAKGIWIALRYEQSFRVQLCVAAVVIFLIFYFQVKLWEAVALLLLVISVLTLELLNSILERIVDVLKPRIHPYVEEVKDLMAGAVLIAAIGALVIGLLILLPYILF